MKKHKILSENQYGFIKNKGTADALNYITHKIYQNLDKSKPMIANFLDLAKAFDTANHDILLSKLERYGIRRKVLLLLKSSLIDNKKFEYKTKQVNTNILWGATRNNTRTATFYTTTLSGTDWSSEPIEVTRGVKQGDPLSPVIFNLVIDQLLRSLPEECGST